jgi:hypothetical protein
MPMRVLHCCIHPDGNPSLLDRLHLSFLGGHDWVAALALFVAVVSFVVARKTLLDAEDSWKQQKWFDLYAKADEAYDTVQLYRTNWEGYLNPNVVAPGIDIFRRGNDWNNLMFIIRRVHSMAMVFPRHHAINKLVAATEFNTPEDAFQDEQLKMFSDAVQDIREMAVLDESILERRERTFWSYIKLW